MDKINLKYKPTAFIGLLFVIAVMLLYFVQLKFIPIPSTTRPASIFIIFPIIFVSFLYSLYDFRVFNKIFPKYMISKWSPLFIVVIIYIIISFFNAVEINDTLMRVLNIVVAFSFYWFGCIKFGFSNKVFIRCLVFSSIPIVIFSLFEIFSLIFFVNLFDWLCMLRQDILVLNLEWRRLHLLFSEPSFLASFLVFLLFIFKQYFKSNTEQIIIYSWLAVIVTLSHSVYVVVAFALIVYFSFLFSKHKPLFKSVLSLFAILLIILFVYIVIGHRLSNGLDDPSFSIRYTHMYSMVFGFIESYGFGTGTGSFSNYFHNFLIHYPEFAWTDELGEFLLNDNLKAYPYSMALSFLLENGVAGFMAFVYLFFKNFRDLRFKEYYLTLFILSFSAIPWGMPYPWVLLGLMDSLNHNMDLTNCHVPYAS